MATKESTVESCTIKNSNKIIKVGDSVLMRAQNPKDPPYLARVEKIQRDAGKKINLLVRWYYRPEECNGGRLPFYGAKEVLASDHLDIQSLDTVEGKCVVHTLENYEKLDPVGEEDYFCRLKYNPAASPRSQYNPDIIDVFCKCEMPYNPDLLMIQCEDCEDCDVTDSNEVFSYLSLIFRPVHERSCGRNHPLG